MDPDNRLLARQSRRRLDAEAVRDAVLSAAGLLHNRLGGPSFKAHLPEGMIDLTFGAGRFLTWQISDPPELYRRAVYAWYMRNLPLPLLVIFDHPDTAESCTRRRVSRSPLQSLARWNAPIFIDSARALARRVLEAKPFDDDHRVEFMFRLCITRPPFPDERDVLYDALRTFRASYADSPSDARQMLGPDSSAAAPRGEALIEAAAWTALARTVLSMEQTISRP